MACYRGALSQEGGGQVKQQGREADFSPPSSVEIKKSGSIPPLPRVSSWHSAYLIKHRDNSTFLGYAKMDISELNDSKNSTKHICS
jgi:hypothetical protein